jgi:hypothetical protein
MKDDLAFCHAVDTTSLGQAAHADVYRLRGISFDLVPDWDFNVAPTTFHG